MKNQNSKAYVYFLASFTLISLNKIKLSSQLVGHFILTISHAVRVWLNKIFKSIAQKMTIVRHNYNPTKTWLSSLTDRPSKETVKRSWILSSISREPEQTRHKPSLYGRVVRRKYW